MLNRLHVAAVHTLTIYVSVPFSFCACVTSRRSNANWTSFLAPAAKSKASLIASSLSTPTCVQQEHINNTQKKIHLTWRHSPLEWDSRWACQGRWTRNVWSDWETSFRWWLMRQRWSVAEDWRAPRTSAIKNNNNTMSLCNKTIVITILALVNAQCKT